MWWTIGGILVFLWLFGFVSQIGGSLIHLLLLVAAVVFVMNFVAGRRRTV